MGRKVAGIASAVMAVVLTVLLVGGQVGSGGFLWWGNREPIYIYGNGGFTIENGVFAGSGTADDPYIIEGWRFDGAGADYGISVAHTTAHFIIRDCVIERARSAGILLSSVRNGRVENVQIALSGMAVHLVNASFNRLEGNVFAENLHGVVASAASEGNVIVGNTFWKNGLHGLDPQRSNHWFADGVGNYWTDYAGFDRNGDGVGDAPYYVLYDRYPLMTPPVEWTRVAPAGLTHAGHPVAPDGSLVVTSRTPIALSALDRGTGVAEIRYTLDDGLTWLVYTAPIHLDGEDGPRRLSYYALDRLGNAERPNTIRLMLDNHPPITHIEVGPPTVQDDRGVWITSISRISLHQVQRSTYGWTQTYYCLDGCMWQRYVGPFTVPGPDGPRRISFYSVNASGRSEEIQTVILLKDDAPPQTRGGRAASAGSAPATSVQLGPEQSSDEASSSSSAADEAGPDVDGEDPLEEASDPDGGAAGLEDLPVETATDASVQTPSDTL